MADEVLEGEGGGKAGLDGLGVGVYDAEERQRVFRLLGLFLERILGCTTAHVSLVSPGAERTRGLGQGRSGSAGWLLRSGLAFAMVLCIKGRVEQLRELVQVGIHGCKTCSAVLQCCGGAGGGGLKPRARCGSENKKEKHPKGNNSLVAGVG